MKIRSALLYTCSVWQVVRFTLLILFVLIAFFPEVRPKFMLLFVWPAVAQFPIAAGFFFLARNEKKYRSYRHLLLLAKGLDAVPGILFLGMQMGALYLGMGSPMFLVAPLIDMFTSGTVGSALVFHYTLAFVVLLDLIFLLVLISLRLEPEESPTSSVLPEYSEVLLEDEKW